MAQTDAPQGDLMNKHATTIASIIALGILFLPALPQRGGDEAHTFLVTKERWAIKTGADPAAPLIRLSPPQPTKVAKLIRLARPVELPAIATSRAAQTTRYGDRVVCSYRTWPSLRPLGSGRHVR